MHKHTHLNTKESEKNKKKHENTVYTQRTYEVLKKYILTQHYGQRTSNNDVEFVLCWSSMSSMRPALKNCLFP